MQLLQPGKPMLPPLKIDVLATEGLENSVHFSAAFID
jgi:hypothetical protein